MLGGPTYTYCDAERAVQKRLRACDVLNFYRALRAVEMESTERALLAKLKSKYDGVQSQRTDDPPVLRPTPPSSNRRRGSRPSGQASLL